MPRESCRRRPGSTTSSAAGFEPVLLARDDAPHRANVVVRVPGTVPSLEGLLVHAHLDVVPAEPEQWSFDPFGGEVADGYVMGRGAMDMKDMCAMTLAVLLDWAATGSGRGATSWSRSSPTRRPTGRTAPSGSSTRTPTCSPVWRSASVSPAGSSRSIAGADGEPVRLARIAAGERGTLHLRLTATGDSGHASRPVEGSAVLALVDALHRIGHHDWPLHVSPLVRAQLEQTAAALGRKADLTTDEGV